jgi:myo-inositol-1(or 4)-monophosphatase
VASRQIRALGAASLDICAVAFGGLDAYIDFSSSGHSPWDYLGGMLVCQQAGAVVAEAMGRELVTQQGRRTIVVAATPPLLEQAVALRAPMA